MKHKGAIFIICLLGLVVTFLSACNNRKYVAADEIFLLKQKDIKINVPDKKDFKGTKAEWKQTKRHIEQIDEDELDGILKTEANSRLLFRFKLGVYNMVNPAKREKQHQKKQLKLDQRDKRRMAKGKDAKRKEARTWRDWLSYTVGERPVTLDSSAVKRSVEQLQISLNKSGFFDAESTFEVHPKRLKIGDKILWQSKDSLRQVLEYTLSPKRPYVLDSIDFRSEDQAIDRKLPFLTERTLLKRNQLFNVDKLDAERERIANILNNRGYYDFTQDFITYQADSAAGNNKVNVTMLIRNQRKNVPGSEQSVAIPHQEFYIGEIQILTDFNPILTTQEASDTLFYKGLEFLYNKKLYFDPDLINLNLFFQEGDLYSKQEVDLTYRRLSELNVFRSVTIRFEPVERDGRMIINCRILLNPLFRQSIAFQAGVTNRQGNLGLPLSFNYGHKNLFGGAEELSASINAAVEAQQIITSSSSGEDLGGNIRTGFGLNTFEIGPEVNLKLHRLPGKRYLNYRKLLRPTTTFRGVFNYQIRPDYERSLSRVKLEFGFSAGRSNFTIDALDLSIIKINKSADFEQRLDELNDLYLTNSYSDHFVPAVGLGWVYNSQKKQTQRSFFLFSLRLEEAGNITRGLMDQFGGVRNPQGSFEILDIPFSNYLRFDGDFKFYARLTDKTRLAFRLTGGDAIPGRNLSVIPFEKSFFAGGSNDLRAWQARTLGPGASRSSDQLITFNNIGDIKILSNLEYRFGVSSFIEGALFADAGNIWLTPQDGLNLLSTFDRNTFLSEVAVGTGLGVRLDFDFFLIRFDFGVQLRDPAKIPGERWAWEPKEEWSNYLISIGETVPVAGGEGVRADLVRYPINLNFGIGYPF